MIKNRANRDSLYATADYWDSKAIDLDGDAVSMWPNNQLNRLYIEEQLTLVDSNLSSVENKSILDVGCGTGRMSRYLSKAGANVTGVDFSANAIEIAESLSNDEKISYQVKSIFDIDDVEKFDIAFSWGCVAIAARNQEELLRALLVIRKSLKPDGRVLMLEPVHKGFVHRVLNINIDEFCYVMQEAGFTVDKVSQMHFWPMRYLLCFVPFPEFITKPFYRLGQLMMKLPLLNRMGDYKAISATVTPG